MGKQCFTCANKVSRELTKAERTVIKQDNVANGKRFKRIPELEFTCKITGNKISQIDPACESYSSNEEMEQIRKDMSDWAREQRLKLEKLK